MDLHKDRIVNIAEAAVCKIFSDDKKFGYIWDYKTERNKDSLCIHIESFNGNKEKYEIKVAKVN